MDAKRQEAVRRLKDLESEIKGGMTTGRHGEIHSPQVSSDTRSVKYEHMFRSFLTSNISHM